MTTTDQAFKGAFFGDVSDSDYNEMISTAKTRQTTKNAILSISLGSTIPRNQMGYLAAITAPNVSDAVMFDSMARLSK